MSMMLVGCFSYQKYFLLGDSSVATRGPEGKVRDSSSLLPKDQLTSTVAQED